ncbi:restriction endonuclease subunit S [Methylophilus sp. 5]|uniref:restriction endonuclease subunit S n=1 Tax=Methylophilus sp. 5 TaxID=1112274 RepID=UPI000688223A|nr:restriction endonuclease subunit S [Methylophilus sp. 5]
MANEWQEFQLGKVCLKIGSGATPRGGKDAYRGGETALIRSQNIYNDRFTPEGLAYIDDSQAHELRNVIVEKNDVLLNITGDSVARCCQVNPDFLPARVNQHVAIIRTQSDVLDSRFLRYVLVSPSMQDHLLALASAGATRNALTKTMIETLDIKAPLIDEQRAIAHILGTLDDKIELNRKQNETLGAIANTLFKAWFVDFEPVRAKIDGRWQRGQSLPGLPAQLYDLFPERFVESELGKIPEGWECLPFGSLLDSTIGGDWGKDAPDDDHTEVISIIRGTDFPDVSSGGIGNVPTRYTTAKKLAPRRLHAGDIVLEISGGSPTQPTGRAIFISEATLERFSNAVVCASFCRRFHPKSAELGVLAFMHLQDLYAAGGTWEYQNQSTGIANFQTTRFLESEMVTIPSAALLGVFTAQVQPLLEKMSSNENLGLINLRDSLLPKLISGELRVSDVERSLEDLA